MTAEVLKKFTAYIMAVNYEISGLGELSVVQHLDGVDFVVKELHLIKQVSTGTSTVLDALSIAQLMGTMMTQKKDLATLKLWWHSHGTLGVFWSGTDVHTIDSFDDGKKDWMLSIVGNRRQNILARLDVYRPFRMTFDKIEVNIIPDEDPYLQAQIDDEVFDKVVYQEPLSVPVPYYPDNGPRFFKDDDSFWENFANGENRYYGK
jgi:hypothetical protein